MIYTPRLYWLAVAVGALLAASIGWVQERSRMTGEIAAPPAELVEKTEKITGASGGDAVAQCANISAARASLGAHASELPAAEQCKPYLDYRDFRGPRAFVYALYGALVGLLAGMFVNKRLREAGKAPAWTD